LRAALPAVLSIELPVAGSKPKFSHTSFSGIVRSYDRRSGKTPTGESEVRSKVSTPTASWPACTWAPPSITACRPVAQACSTWKPGMRRPALAATSGAP